VAGRASGIKMGDDGGGSLISPDGVAPCRIVVVSASCYLPLHHRVQKKISSGTGSPGWSWKKGRKTVVCACACLRLRNILSCIVQGSTTCCQKPKTEMLIQTASRNTVRLQVKPKLETCCKICRSSSALYLSFVVHGFC